MTLILEVALLFFVIFFAVRFATTGHTDKGKVSEPQSEEIVYLDAQPVS